MEKVVNILSESKKTKNKFAEHNCFLENRNKLHLTGVEKVISVNPTSVVVSTQSTRMNVGGSNLEIIKLDVETGVINLEGNVDSIKYDKGSKIPFYKRIFK